MRRLFKLSAKHAPKDRHYPRVYERLVPVLLVVLAILVIAVLATIALVLAGVIGT